MPIHFFRLQIYDLWISVSWWVDVSLSNRLRQKSQIQLYFSKHVTCWMWNLRMLFILEMIVEMIYGVLETLDVMLGFGEVMFIPLRRYVSISISHGFVCYDPYTVCFLHHWRISNLQSIENACDSQFLIVEKYIFVVRYN